MFVAMMDTCTHTSYKTDTEMKNSLLNKIWKWDSAKHFSLQLSTAVQIGTTVPNWCYTLVVIGATCIIELNINNIVLSSIFFKITN